MSDPRWPSLREAARRFLREDDCILSVEAININQAWSLIQSISDHIPSKTSLPNVIEGDFQIIGIADFGANEPDTKVCWVPLGNWPDFFEQVTDLLEAGYPGCIGVQVREQKVSGMRPLGEANLFAKKLPYFLQVL